ncbi:hypothetical protein AXA44_30910 [Rhodococcus sp. SC4]|nr:hypothetical protein AXA44_30910 [Rhodococcus sp. SC4]
MALSQEDLDWVDSLIESEIRPLEAARFGPQVRAQLIAGPGARVRERGLWAPHLPISVGGAGLSYEELTALFERLGRCPLAPIAFGSWAPDSVNALLLAEAGSPEQRKRWLDPLVAGRVTSAFAMTEPGAGSDPTLFTSTAVPDGDEWILNGHKWWISNATNADLLIAVFVTDPDATPHARASIFLVPADSPGVEVVRDIAHLANPTADESAIERPAEVRFTDVRVPRDALVGARGDGFRLAQVRLAMARLQHCMRWIGQAEKALQLMCDRAATRFAHGSVLAEKANIQQYIAEAATGIHTARLLVTDTARRIDASGTRAAQAEIAMCKVVVAQLLVRTVDRAIQVHGAYGLSTDLPLEEMARQSRAAQILDGPDEVHNMVISRLTVRRFGAEATNQGAHPR